MIPDLHDTAALVLYTWTSTLKLVEIHNNPVKFCNKKMKKKLLYDGYFVAKNFSDEQII